MFSNSDMYVYIVYIDKYIHMGVAMYKHMYTYIYLKDCRCYVCIYRHANVHTHMHTYMHALNSKWNPERGTLSS